MTFWRVLRERHKELAAVCALTPHSRAEYLACYNIPDDLDDLERARRVWTLLAQGRAGSMRRTGWRLYRDPGGTNSSMPDYLTAYADRMLQVAARLQGVSLECRDAHELIAHYGEIPDLLIYADPPYLRAMRSASGRCYWHEIYTEEEHRKLAEVITACKSAVIVSGYAHPLYDDELYADWYTLDIKTFSGQAGNAVDGRRTERLWSNRPFPAQLGFDMGAPA